MTGPELKQLPEILDDAIGRSLSAAKMAKRCGPRWATGADTMTFGSLRAARPRPVDNPLPLGRAA